MGRLKHGLETLSGRRYLFLILSPLYLLGTALLYAYIYNGDPRAFYHTYPWTYTLPFTLFTVLISVLLGGVITLFVARLREVRLKSAGLGAMGVFVGSLAAGCPGCLFGLFPLVLGFFGISGTLALLPWNGIEFQIATVALLGLSAYTLSGETDVSCKVRRR